MNGGKKIDLAFICGQVDWILTESCPTEPPAPVRKSKDTNDVQQKKQRDYALLKIAYDLENKRMDQYQQNVYGCHKEYD